MPKQNVTSGGAGCASYQHNGKARSAPGLLQTGLILFFFGYEEIQKAIEPAYVADLQVLGMIGCGKWSL
jgi:hypothetical protein